MKRLNLEDFKSKNTDAIQPKQTDALLGQVLGDCHDKPKKGIVELGGEFLDHLAKRFNLKPVK